MKKKPIIRLRVFPSLSEVGEDIIIDASKVRLHQIPRLMAKHDVSAVEIHNL